MTSLEIGASTGGRRPLRAGPGWPLGVHALARQASAAPAYGPVKDTAEPFAASMVGAPEDRPGGPC